MNAGHLVRILRIATDDLTFIKNRVRQQDPTEPATDADIDYAIRVLETRIENLKKHR